MGSNRTVATSDDDEESDDQENVKDAQQDSGIVTGPMARFIDPDQSCSSTSALVNRNEEDLVRTLLELDIKSMFNDMNGNNKPTILSTGYLRPHPSPEEIWNPVKLLNETFPRTRDKIPSADKPNLLDRHNRIMAAILTRFRNMVLAATEPLPTAAAIPQASLNAMTMNNEVSALIKEIENLLALNREIKKLWIAGPLRKPGDADEKNREKEIDEKASQVSKLYNTLVELESEIAKKSAAQQALVAAEEAKVKKDDGNVHIKHEDQSDSA
ncbi:hypothetical protein E0Z10_g4793 [Xylaria hypoxylon]|uniref:Uncharacterized protein n=1 Tax=Xylaria hypoxylon TaxID=37992 RepID=A0A4Z0Z304_9PEZI|nr:hypothetical protein E0Z10_g4793 [Xylaria hypoxylon]